MPKFYPSLTPALTDWLLSQPLFFISTAPLTGAHINLSPKGPLSTSLAILSPNRAIFLDLTGSGSETIAHLYENGRATIMLASFDSSPRIMRLFCRGSVVEPDNLPLFPDLVAKVPGAKSLPGIRAVVVLDIYQVQTSCGYGVPIVTATNDKVQPYFEPRPTLSNWLGKKVDFEELSEYQREWNSESLDGLPALRMARRKNGEKLLFLGDLKAWARRMARSLDVMLPGLVVGLLIGMFWKVVGEFVGLWSGQLRMLVAERGIPSWVSLQ